MGNFKNARIKGDIFAFEADGGENNYVSNLAPKLYKFFLDNNVLLRPLGNTIYVMPPYCIKEESLDKIFGLLKKIK